jgi:hypothetical protein
MTLASRIGTPVLALLGITLLTAPALAADFGDAYGGGYVYADPGLAPLPPDYVEVAPAYPDPVYAAPVYPDPAYAPPVYSAPVYAEPEVVVVPPPVDYYAPEPDGAFVAPGPGIAVGFD